MIYKRIREAWVELKASFCRISANKMLSQTQTRLKAVTFCWKYIKHITTACLWTSNCFAKYVYSVGTSTPCKNFWWKQFVLWHLGSKDAPKQNRHTFQALSHSGGDVLSLSVSHSVRARSRGRGFLMTTTMPVAGQALLGDWYWCFTHMRTSAWSMVLKQEDISVHAPEMTSSGKRSFLITQSSTHYRTLFPVDMVKHNCHFFLQIKN